MRKKTEITAKEARKLAGADPRTIDEQFLDDVVFYIKSAASRGKRDLLYRIPDKYDSFVWRIVKQLEFMGFDVKCNYPSNREIMVAW